MFTFDRLSLFMLTCTLLLLNGCSFEKTSEYNGYAEAELVYIASGISGYLKSLPVQRGDWVKKSTVLFELETKDEVLAQTKARAKLRGQIDTLNDIKKGKRPDEIAALMAQKDQALAALNLSKLELERNKRLLVAKATAQEQYDIALTTNEKNEARVEEIESNLQLAQLGNRSDQILAAEANVTVAQAELDLANWQFAQKKPLAPVDAKVEDTLYQAGEWVTAGKPVVVLLPKENIKIRFFIPESDLASLKIGQAIQVGMDGVNDKILAKISFISERAEFTPPVIFSVESRKKLVFMVEARPELSDAFKLHPGQPVTIFMNAANDHVQ